MAVFCYMAGYLLALGGAAVALMSGFVRTRERLDTLARFIAKLTPEQWSSLTRYARTLVSVREHIEAIDIHPASKKALRKSADNLINEHAKMLVKLEVGTLEIRGPVMDDIFQYFLESVQQSFRAISRDDLAYWTSPDCARYLDANRRLIDEGRAVERIFLLRQNEGLSPDSVDGMASLIAELLPVARGGGMVAIHCWAGLGRTGLVGACCLVALGLGPAQAIAAVRLCRPRSIENSDQEEFIVHFAAALAAVASRD